MVHYLLLSSNIIEKTALIWEIADKLTGVYKPDEYGEVILLLTVIHRFDCILADKKDEMIRMEELEQVRKEVDRAEGKSRCDRICLK